MATAILASWGCSNREESTTAERVAMNAVGRADGFRARRVDRKPHCERDPRPSLREAGEFDGLTSSEAAVVDRVNALLEAEDAKRLYSMSGQIRNTKNAEVREEYVKALGWFGEEALSELVPFIDDEDESVATEARCQWLNALYSIDDDATKGEIIRYALCNIGNQELIEDVATEINALDEKLGMGILIDAIESNNAVGKAAALEAYETMTGDEFISVAAAEQWLKEQESD